MSSDNSTNRFIPATDEERQSYFQDESEMPQSTPALDDFNKRCIEIIANQGQRTQEDWQAHLRTHFYGS